jgi:hypothetical protein
MREVLRRLRRLRCTTVSPAGLFSRRLRVGFAIALLILLFSLLR